MNQTEFFITQGSAADNTLGGGPRLGTNDGPVYTTADSTVAAGSLTTITDNAGTWSGVQADDFISWNPSGSTWERRRVVSNNGDGTITVDSACTAGANRTCNVGGAWATTAAIGYVYNTMVNAAGDNPRINIKAGTYSNAFTSYMQTGSSTVSITVEGYTTTPGDGGRATIVTSSTSYTTIDGNTKHYCIYKNLNLSFRGGGANFALRLYDAQYVRVINVKIEGTTSYNSNATSGPYYTVFHNCEFYRCYMGAMYGVKVHGCTYHGSSYGINGADVNVVDSVFYDITTAAIYNTSSPNHYARLIRNNTFDNCAKGIHFESTMGMNAAVENNVFINCTTGMASATAGQVYSLNNAFYNVSTKYSGCYEHFPNGDIDLTVDPRALYKTLTIAGTMTPDLAETYTLTNTFYNGKRSWENDTTGYTAWWSSDDSTWYLSENPGTEPVPGTDSYFTASGSDAPGSFYAGMAVGNVSVSVGTASPNVSGTYVPAGTHNGYPYYQNGSYYLYYSDDWAAWLIGTDYTADEPSAYFYGSATYPQDDCAFDGDGGTYTGSCTGTGTPMGYATTTASALTRSLNNVSGGGAACRTKSLPMTMLDGETDYLDIGALQSQGSVAAAPIAAEYTFAFIG